MSTSFVSKIGKRGTFVIPAELREKFSLHEGDLVITEVLEDGLLLKPAVALPVESYTKARKAEFLLSNSLSKDEYEAEKKMVISMGLDPDNIKHYPPDSD